MHLAQINIAKMLEPIDSTLLADFVAQLDEINALGEASEGFVWRFKDETGNATNVQPFANPMIIVNMTVWESVESLKNFTYKSDHVRVFRERRKWFDPNFDLPNLAMWWIEEGHIPTLEEAQSKIYQLHEFGASEEVFTFREVM